MKKIIEVLKGAALMATTIPLLTIMGPFNRGSHLGDGFIQLFGFAGIAFFAALGLGSFLLQLLGIPFLLTFLGGYVLTCLSLGYVMVEEESKR